MIHNVLDDVRQEVLDELDFVGIPCHIKGRNYIAYAVHLCVEDISLLDAITYGLYPKIAKEFGTTPSKVERAIRFAVQYVFDNTEPDRLFEIFKNTLSIHRDVPTNSQFIATLTWKVRREILDKKN